MDYPAILKSFNKILYAQSILCLYTMVNIEGHLASVGFPYIFYNILQLNPEGKMGID